MLCGRRVLGVALGLSALMVSAGRGRTIWPRASSAPPTVDIETLGPKVGDTLPDFDLPDQHGQRHSLKSSLAGNGAVLVFFRSADW
jgi:hypothetical protein